MDNPSRNIQHFDDGYMAYMRSMYWAMVGMSTVGYGDIVPRTGNLAETVAATIIIWFGGLLYPAVIGGMASLMGNLNAAQVAYSKKISNLRKFMERKRLPMELRERIIRFYNYLWTRQNGVDENAILEELPRPLRIEVSEWVNGKMLRNIDFFRGLDPEMMDHLLGVLKPAIFLPSDKIITAGDCEFRRIQ